jgi:hypothetical protein
MKKSLIKQHSNFLTRIKIKEKKNLVKCFNTLLEKLQTLEERVTGERLGSSNMTWTTKPPQSGISEIKRLVNVPKTTHAHVFYWYEMPISIMTLLFLKSKKQCTLKFQNVKKWRNLVSWRHLASWQFTFPHSTSVKVIFEQKTTNAGTYSAQAFVWFDHTWLFRFPGRV